MFGIGFKEAFEGLFKLTTTEKNFKFHLVAAAIVIIAAFYFNFTLTEWLILILTISFVLVSEAFNTAIEVLIDYVDKRRNANIKIIKDISASAVLLSAINSIVVGIILFYPKILILLK